MPIEIPGTAATHDRSETRARFTSDQGRAPRPVHAYEGTGRDRPPAGRSEASRGGVRPGTHTGRRPAHRPDVTIPAARTDGRRHLISIVRGKVAPCDRRRGTLVSVR